MAVASITGNMDQINLADFYGADITQDSSTTLQLDVTPSYWLRLNGMGFTYDAFDQLNGGTVTALTYSHPAADGSNLSASVTGLNLAAAQFGPWVYNDQTQTALNTIFGQNDTMSGSAGADLIRGFGGADQITGAGGADSLWGGAGDDQISATASSGGTWQGGGTYLRGEDGNDSIAGGSGFDDINGNVGNDTAHGGAAQDWVVGGKDQDLLYGDDGDDIVYGNLGNDTLDGGAGNDLVRGGQGDDVAAGGDGNDYISGDLGSDTLTGGAGADIFHTFSTAGLDRVTDFNAAEGDRVQVDQGSSYTLSQQGADTVIDFGNGNEMVLAGVQLNSLQTGWIFTAPA